MTEPTYTLTLTESERTAMARSLGLLVTKLLNAPIFVEGDSRAINGHVFDKDGICKCGMRFEQREFPHTATSQDPPTRNASSEAAHPSGHAPPVLPEPRDRWARNRKGEEVPNPEGCERITVHLWKAERNDLSDGTPRMSVAWKAATARESGSAACFEKDLFPWLAVGTQTSKPSILYIVHIGKYTNVVGVRA